MGLLKTIAKETNKAITVEALSKMIDSFIKQYAKEALKGGTSQEQINSIFKHYKALIEKQIASPYEFKIYHERDQKPVNYYQFALDFIRPLVDFKNSTISGQANLKSIEKALAKGENVILLSNHQIEPDPQAINLLLENSHPQLSANMIFIAGHRVVTDPIAVPLSRGVNLLCIFSKNYMEVPIELKHDKLMHNRKTMQKMVDLFNEGGKCIYVAPSGGRDRPDSTGKLKVSNFDPNSIEMFYLMAKQSNKPIHFYTLALSTYAIQPPPDQVERKLEANRTVNYTPIHLHFGNEIDMDSLIDEDLPKQEKRKMRAEYIWNQVSCDYESLPLN